MAAKNVSKAIKAVAQPFEDIGNKIGGLAKSLPKYAPILPQNMGGSISGLGKVADGLSRIPEYRAQERYDDSSTGKWIKSQTGQSANASDIAALQSNLASHPEKVADSIAGKNLETFKQLLPEIQKHEETKNADYWKVKGKYDSTVSAEIARLVKE